MAKPIIPTLSRQKTGLPQTQCHPGPYTECQAGQDYIKPTNQLTHPTDKNPKQPEVVLHDHSPSTWEVQPEISGVQDYRQENRVLGHSKLFMTLTQNQIRPFKSKQKFKKKTYT